MKNLAARLEQLMTRLPWLLPVTGFVGGLVSFVLVKRGDDLAVLTAVLVLGGWLWLILAPWISRLVRMYTSRKVTSALLNFVTQSIQQEILFFVLPFVLLSTRIQDIGQLFFALLVMSLAAVSTIDPIYERFIASCRPASMLFHGICSFVSALVILPIVAGLPLEHSFRIALGLFVLSALAALPSTLLRRNGRLRASGMFPVLLLLPLLTAALNAHIPAAVLRVEEAVITLSVNKLEPGPGVSRIGVEDLGKGIYAYARVTAPEELQQEIVFNWIHGDYHESIPSVIQGGREAGYRTWSVKRNFVSHPEGLWQVEITTPQGQLLETLEFEVVSSR